MFVRMNAPIIRGLRLLFHDEGADITVRMNAPIIRGLRHADLDPGHPASASG